MCEEPPVVVIRELETRVFPCGAKSRRWLCRCHCGKEFTVAKPAIKKGLKSCGCRKYRGIVHGNASQDPQVTSWKGVLNRYKQSARNRKRNWDLTDEQAYELMKGRCYYCGRPPSSSYNRYKRKFSGRSVSKNEEWVERLWIKYNGIDRKNNDVGYTVDNCVTCCTVCNYAKRNMTMQEFEQWLDDMVRHRASRS